MSHRKHFSLGFIFLLLALPACHHHDDSQSSVLDPVVPVSLPASAVAPADNSDAAAALAAHANQYASEVSPLLNQEAAAKPAPSVVKWAEPGNDAKISTVPVVPISKANTAISATQPSASALPEATARAAVLASSKTNEEMSVPIILPESADHLAESGPVAAATASSDDYEKKLAQQVRDYPRDLGNQLNYQLLRFARDEPTPDLESIATMPAEDREIVSALLDGLNNFRNNARADGNQLLSHKIQPLLEISDRLRSEAELTIPTIALCTNVESFGVYKPLASLRLPAGQENEVIVYCEVSNFTSVQNSDKIWETRLKQECSLYSDSGLMVWPSKSNAQLFLDQARNRRHDFFVPRKVKLPSTLSIGRYLLKVTLMDQQSNRIAEATTPFEIVAE